MADFRKSEFRSKTDFQWAEFRGERAVFDHARFRGEVAFVWARFTASADFVEAEFSRWASFRAAKLLDWSSFLEARFGGETSFEGTEFGIMTTFSKAKFGKERTTFEGATVGGQDISFEGALFDGEVSFQNAKFKAAAFIEAAFNEETSFEGAKFGWTSFRKAKFGEKRTGFGNAKLGGDAIFQGACFGGETDFHDSILRDATFESATFQRGAIFTKARFTGTGERTTDFRRATFGGEVYFKEAMFRGEDGSNGYVDFYRTNFLDAAKFVGGVRRGGTDSNPVFHPDVQVSFTRARIDKPELFSFDTVDLRPSWLVGVDARKFDFTAVKWYGLRKVPGGSFDDEVRRVQQKEHMEEENVKEETTEEDETEDIEESSLAYVRLAQACQRLAANAEENRDYPTANEFHCWSMEAQRKDRFHGFVPWRLSWWYWLLSGYSERPLRALCLLGVIYLGFALLYMQLPLLPEASSDSSFWTGFGRATLYSFGVITRQKVSPEPEVGWTQFFVLLEGILGPLQFGLMALALRRIFMR